MNKAVLTIAGVAIASLAAGGAGGYFIAKNQIEKQVAPRIAKEVAAVKKHYALREMERASGKPASPLDIPLNGGATKSGQEATPEEVALVKADKTKQQVKPATPIDYRTISAQKMAEQEEGAEVHQNVFNSKGPAKKRLPPRDETDDRPRDEHGRFLPRAAVVPEQRSDGPYEITHDEFLENVVEYGQENLYYYRNNDTVVMAMDLNDSVDPARLGEENLRKLAGGEDGSILCVRNEGLQMDYEITLCLGDLTVDLGLGDVDDMSDLAEI